MSVAQLRAMLDDRAQVVPLTLEQYHRMIEQGILPEGEPIELLDGFLVRKDRSARGGDPMTVGHKHASVIRKLSQVLRIVEQHGHFVQIQLPATVPPDSEPEPDAAIVRGTPDDYRGRHPGPDDVVCVIEVADSSVQHDRTTKLRIYAQAGIGQYLLVNLAEGKIEDYRKPVTGEGRYDHGSIIAKGQQIELDLGERQLIEIPASDLLP